MESDSIKKNCPECGEPTELKAVVCDCGHWFFRDLEKQQSSELEQVRWKERAVRIRNVSVFGGSALLLLCVPAYWGGYFGGLGDPTAGSIGSAAEVPEPATSRPGADTVIPGNITLAVVGVLTGDTVIVVDQQNRERRIRISGIAAPKLDQEGGLEARENLSRLVQDKSVFIRQRSAGPSGEIVADLVRDGLNIGLEQLRSGMARLVESEIAEQVPELRQAYLEADGAARNSRLGLWATGDTGEPLPAYTGLYATRYQDPARVNGVNRMPTANAAAEQPTIQSTASEVPDSSDPPAPIEDSRSASASATTVSPTVPPRVAPSAEPSKVVVSQPATKMPSAPANGQRVYTLGPRGGCFYISASGSKTYVDRSRCN